ncbi:hypothetical protein Sango_1869700 [Sesamum angolense]|uniref:Reverse transcriptase Ty1/copia-type domain-containing protein n=1 Tax=Sesamum angolense TaxID=2727404 RepID=A0AAE1WIT2_9LAMI|nr:hypothetical protein Sango_1869700 [Sesamum angolense]
MTKIWQMDVKTEFLNGFIEEEIYIDHPVGFMEKSKRFIVSIELSRVFMLYMDDIFIIKNDAKMLGDMGLRHQTCVGEVHWIADKTILKYLRITQEMFFMYSGGVLVLEGYIEASFQFDADKEAVWMKNSSKS